MTQQPTTFKIEEKLIDIKKGDKVTKYLPVLWRLVWFRELYPNGTIDTEMVHLDLDRHYEIEVVYWENGKRKTKMKHGNGYACFKAIVATGEGGRATGHKKENAANFGDFEEKAETGSIGRALAALGFGTQFTDEEFAEGERLADSPVQRGNGQQQRQPAAKDEDPAVEAQISSIKKLYAKIGKEPEKLEGLTYGQAKGIIQKLNAELRGQPKADAPAPAKEQSNGHQAQPTPGPKAEPEPAPAPAPAANGVKLIAENQIVALLNLYQKIGQQPPADLQQWSYEQASVGIKKLNAKLKAKAS